MKGRNLGIIVHLLQMVSILGSRLGWALYLCYFTWVYFLARALILIQFVPPVNELFFQFCITKRPFDENSAHMRSRR